MYRDTDNDKKKQKHKQNIKMEFLTIYCIALFPGCKCNHEVHFKLMRPQMFSS